MVKTVNQERIKYGLSKTAIGYQYWSQNDMLFIIRKNQRGWRVNNSQMLCGITVVNLTEAALLCKMLSLLRR